MESILAEGLTKEFDDFVAVEEVSLRVPPGQILVLLGPNGAGKTTTIRMLASILRPTRGRVVIAGHDAAADPVAVRRSVGLLTEHHGLYTRMRAQEYLRFFGRAYGVSRAEADRRAESLLEHYGLSESVGRRLGEYSKGMRQKLALVRALLHDPQVLLLDEPTSAMDPASARIVRRGIAGLRSAERAIVVCTHNLTEAELLADQLAIIQRGRIIAVGTPQDLKRRMLGDPIMELRLAGSLDGAARLLPPAARLVASGPAWLRYRTPQPEIDNPHLLQALADQGVGVVTLSEVGRSLEDMYLQVVGAAPEPDGDPQ
jgi:ABC-2 type transport system ATP-binding protein